MSRYAGKDLGVSSQMIDDLEDSETDGEDVETEDQEEEANQNHEAREPERIQLGKDCFLTMKQFELACKLRKLGKSTSYRDLMDLFDVPEHHAKELNKQIRKALGQAPEAGE